MTNEKYLVDSSTLIDLLEKRQIKNAEMERKNALLKLQDALKKDNRDLYVDSLIVFEVLRRYKAEEQNKFDQYKESLAQFDVIEVDSRVYDIALILQKHCKSKGLTYNDKLLCNMDGCRHKGRLVFNSTDFIHCAVAKLYDLDIIATDGDFKQIADICKDLSLDLKK